MVLNTSPLLIALSSFVMKCVSFPVYVNVAYFSSLFSFFPFFLSFFLSFLSFFSVPTRGGGGKPVQITSARGAGRGPGARLWSIYFCLSR